MTATTHEFDAQEMLPMVEQFTRDLAALPSNGKLEPAVLEVIYSMAYGLLKQCRYDDAARYFNFLRVYAPLDTRFLSGLAVCCQAEGRVDEAIRLYSLAAYVEPSSCKHALALAESLIQRQAHDAAAQLLKMVVRIGAAQGDNVAGDRARALLDLLAAASSSVTSPA